MPSGKFFNGFWRESVKPLLLHCGCLPITFLANLNKLLFWNKLMVFDNPIVRWLATRRKDNMYALACKLTVMCSFAVHALVVSVIVYYLSHAKNYD